MEPPSEHPLFQNTRSLIFACIAGVAGFLVGRWEWAKPPVAPESSVPTALATQASGATPKDSAQTATLPRAEEKTSLDQLKAALAEKDIFRASRTAADWVEAATLEDFRAFVRDPKPFPRPYYTGFDATFQNAFLDSFVDRWLTLEPRDVTLIHGQDDVTSDFARAAARVKPEVVLAAIYHEKTPAVAASYADDAFASLAKRDIAAARRMLATLKSERERQTLEFAVVTGLAQADVFAAIAALPAKPDKPDGLYASTVDAIVRAAERIGPGVLRKVFAEAGGKLDSAVVPELLLRQPDLAADLAARGAGKPAIGWIGAELFRAADGLPPESQAQLLADYEKLPAAGRDQICAALASAWARTDPRAAAAWAIEHAQPSEISSPANSAVNYVFLRWVNSDPSAARAWWETLPPSPMRDRIGSEAATRFAEEGDFETALKMFRPLPELAGYQTAEHLALLYAEHDPAAAAAWFATLPAGITEQRSIASIASRYYHADPVGAAQWVDALTPGPTRDQALRYFAAASAQAEPAQAARRAEQIQDPEVREQACVEVAFTWRNRDPEAMRTWVQNESPIGDSWRAAFLPP